MNRQCRQDEAAEGEEKGFQDEVHVSLLITGGQSGQLLNSGVLSGGRQDPPAKRLLDINADLVPSVRRESSEGFRKSED